MTIVDDEIKEFIAHWFPLPDAEDYGDEALTESFCHVIHGEIVGHLSILYRVLTADAGVMPDTPALHVALICNAAVKAEWRGCGIMHGLKEQAHARARKTGMLFAVSIARWPAKQKRYGYVPAPGLGKHAMVLQLTDVPFPKGKVRLTEGDKWE